MSEKSIIKHVNEIEAVDVPRSPGASIKVILGDKDQMPHFHTRIFTLEPGAVIPGHLHDTIEHEQVMLEGTMRLTIGDDEYIVKPGHVMYLPKGLPHSYENIGDTPVRFVCCIPANLPYSTNFQE